MKCRHCSNELVNVFCDLQTCPPSNAMVTQERLNQPETYFPLKVYAVNSVGSSNLTRLKKQMQFLIASTLIFLLILQVG